MQSHQTRRTRWEEVAILVMTLVALLLSHALMTQAPERIPEPLPQPTATPRLPTLPDNPQRTHAKAQYPELVERVDRSLESLDVELLTPTRNATNTGWVFPWKLRHFTPPVLTGVKGGEVRNPNALPFMLVLSFNLHPVGQPLSAGITKVGLRNGVVEILDTDMPPGEVEWSVQGFYHSHAYSQVTGWMPWQRLRAG